MHDRSHKPQPAEAGNGGPAGEGGGGNVDRVLFKNLVEMVPLVESLMDRRANPAYSRRASLVYTPAPPKKASDLKSVKLPQSLSAKKRRDPGDAAKKSAPDSNGDNGSVVPLSLSGAENKPKDEVAVLREQIDDLQTKLLEKEAALRSAESSVAEMNAAYATIDELRRVVADKEALIRSTNSQLRDAKALYGYEPNLGAAPTISENTSADVEEIITNRAAHLESLKAHLAKAQNKMKVMADRLRTDHQYQVGDQVLLKLQPYTQSSVANRPYPKLAYKFFGPYTILEKIGAVAYKLQLPADALIHPAFHISQLKPFTPDHTPVFDQLPVITDIDVAAAVPSSILERRLMKKGNRAIQQVRVSWITLPTSAASWEDYHVLKARFPEAPAWGQAPSSAGGHVTAAAESSI